MFRRIIRRIFGRATPPPHARAAPVHRPPPRPDPPPAPTPGADLVLYKFDRCPYCRRVMQAIERLNLSVEMADIRNDPAAREHLFQQTGRHTVPCLFIDGTPLFESADIIAWLEAQSAQRPTP